MCKIEEAPSVCVTGSNGFLGSHIVEQCLRAGYKVRGTVRDALDMHHTKHLRNLTGAATHLELFSAEMRHENTVGFDDAIAGCTSVIHAASPFSDGFLSNEEVHSAVFGTLAVLRACKRLGVKTVVMTSSMSVAVPQTQGGTICESNWADPASQIQDGNLCVALKILAEKAAWEFMRKEEPNFRLVTILPSCIVGPSIRGDLGFTNRRLLALINQTCRGKECPNESCSFVDVRDCAAHHIAAMEQKTAEGRYLCAAGSMHWNDLARELKRLSPRIPKTKLCNDPCDPFHLDRARQDSLRVNIRDMQDILCDAADHSPFFSIL